MVTSLGGRANSIRARTQRILHSSGHISLSILVSLAKHLCKAYRGGSNPYRCIRSRSIMDLGLARSVGGLPARLAFYDAFAKTQATYPTKVSGRNP
jgi:hypothetical protein